MKQFIHKKSVIIMSIVLLSVVITAAASGMWNAVTQPLAQVPGTQLTTVRAAVPGETTDPIYTYLAATYTGDSLYEKVDSYAIFKMTNQPTAAEIQYLHGLLTGGAPIDAVLDAYDFWITTNAELSLVGQLTAVYTPEMARSHYWAEEVYDAITANTNALTPEEVNAYLQEEVTQEDIMLANELSRKNVYTIKEILSKRKQEKNWYEIISELYAGVGTPLNVPASKVISYRAIVNGNDIVKAIFLSKRSDKSLEQWLDMAAQDTNTFHGAVSDYHTELVANELQSLKGRGLYALTGEDAQAQASQEAYLETQLQAQGADMQQVEALQTQGYDTAEILNAAIEAKTSNRSLLQELEQ